MSIDVWLVAMADWLVNAHTFAVQSVSNHSSQRVNMQLVSSSSSSSSSPSARRATSSYSPSRRNEHGHRYVRCFRLYSLQADRIISKSGGNQLLPCTNVAWVAWECYLATSHNIRILQRSSLQKRNTFNCSLEMGRSTNQSVVLTRKLDGIPHSCTCHNDFDFGGFRRLDSPTVSAGALYIAYIDRSIWFMSLAFS